MLSHFFLIRMIQVSYFQGIMKSIYLKMYMYVVIIHYHERYIRMCEIFLNLTHIRDKIRSEAKSNAKLNLANITS